MKQLHRQLTGGRQQNIFYTCIGSVHKMSSLRWKVSEVHFEVLNMNLKLCKKVHCLKMFCSCREKKFTVKTEPLQKRQQSNSAKFAVALIHAFPPVVVFIVN